MSISTDKPTAMTRGEFGLAHVTSEQFLSAIVSIAEIHFERQDVSREELFDNIRMFAAVTLSRKGRLKGQRREKLDDLSNLDNFVTENLELLDPIVQRAMVLGGWSAK